MEELQTAISDLPAEELARFRGGLRSTWPNNGIERSRPISWPGDSMRQVNGPMRISRPVAAHLCREPFCHPGILVPLPSITSGNSRGSRSLLSATSTGPASSLLAVQRWVTTGLQVSTYAFERWQESDPRALCGSGLAPTIGMRN